MKERLGVVAALALLAGLAAAPLAWRSKTSFFLAPPALFAAASALGFVAWRTRAGKVAALAGVAGVTLWAVRFAQVVSDELGSIWRGG